MNPEKKSEPEKYFAKAIAEYFSFHKKKFRDPSGFALEPDWKSGKRPMELKNLKLLLGTLRQICEKRGEEWTEEVMIKDFNNFMERAMNHNLVKKDFLICMMNRFKIQILSSSYNPHLVKKILEVWYEVMPDYTRDFDKDKEAAEIIIGFLKQQYVLSSIEFTDESVVQSVRLIFKKVLEDEWWVTKPLKTISKNLQEFVNRIKANKNVKRVNSKTDGIEYAFNQALGRDKAPGL